MPFTRMAISLRSRPTAEAHVILMDDTKTLKEYINTTIIVIISWLMLALLAAWFFGFWPVTIKGWLVTLIAGPIVWVVWELFGEVSRKIIGMIPLIGAFKKSAEIKDPGKHVSLYRILYLFLEIVIIGAFTVGLIIFLNKFFGNSFEPISLFLQENFK